MKQIVSFKKKIEEEYLMWAWKLNVWNCNTRKYFLVYFKINHKHDYCGSLQKRRSNRQIKRKKYAEDAEGKQSEEEVKGSIRIKKNSAPLPGEQPLQLFVVRHI